MTKEIIKTYSLEKPAEMIEMAGVLKNYIVKQALYSKIQGKNYVHADGWQFAGFLTGMIAIVDSIKDLSSEGEIKWQAVVKIYSGQGEERQHLSTGVAVCSNNEKSKAKFDEYAILSMAQTRAIGKAYRNKLGWVMKLAGYESTNAEEMDGNGKKAPVKKEKEEKPKESYRLKVIIECKKQLKVKKEDAISWDDFEKYVKEKTGSAVNDDTTEKSYQLILAKLIQADAKS